MDEEKIVPIPEQITNEVVLLMNEMKDHDKEIAYRTQKKTFVQAKLWDLIGEKLPETRGVNCTINPKNKTITVNKKRPNMSDFLKGFMGSGQGDDD